MTSWLLLHKKLGLVVVFALASLSFGCANLERSPGSGYAGKSEGHESSDLGHGQEERGDLSRRLELNHLEGRLESRREKEQYSKILPWLKNDQEKIQFLSIDHVEERQAWIQSHEIWKRAQAPEPVLKAALDSGDIAVGMQMDYVKKAWGEPQGIDVSGNPLYHNERWRYTRFVSAQDGYHQEKRFVYFEGGRVVGWETE